MLCCRNRRLSTGLLGRKWFIFFNEWEKKKLNLVLRLFLIDWAMSPSSKFLMSPVLTQIARVIGQWKPVTCRLSATQVPSHIRPCCSPGWFYGIMLLIMKQFSIHREVYKVRDFYLSQARYNRSVLNWVKAFLINKNLCHMSVETNHNRVQ